MSRTETTEAARKCPENQTNVAEGSNVMHPEGTTWMDYYPQQLRGQNTMQQ